MKKLFWLFLLLAWPGLAFAQGARIDNPGGPATRNVQNFLAPIPGATITVCTSAATGTPCTPVVPTSPATLCTDSTCSVAAANPFPADANGNWGAWLLPGNYTYSVTASGVTGKLFNLTIPAVTPINLSTQTTGQINLATQVTGTLPGANYAPVNLAAGNVNGGATGVLPAANLPATTSNCSGVQFAQGLNAGMTPVCATPPTFVASGASHAVGYVPDPGASAGTTHFLREDATWATVPSSGVTEATFTLQAAGLLGTTGTCGSTGSFVFCNDYILANAHTLTRFVAQVIVAPVGCSTNAVLAVRDITASSNLTTLTPTTTGVSDSGALSIAMTAGHTFGIGLVTAPSGCSTFINVGLTAVFQ